MNLAGIEITNETREVIFECAVVVEDTIGRRLDQREFMLLLSAIIRYLTDAPSKRLH